MYTKKRKFTDNISVAFNKETKQQMIKLASETNISQGEFIRNAVEYYITYLTELNRQDLYIGEKEYDN